MDTLGKVSLTNSFKIVVYNKFVAFDGIASNEFGWCVSFSADGNTAIIGVFRNNIGANINQGAAYVNKWNGSTWIQTKLTASDGAANDYFGRSVMISADGNTLIVGALLDDIVATVDQGSAYVYQWNGSSWTQQTKFTASDGAANDRFGYSVAVSADGNIAAVGALGDDGEAGSAYVYKWNGTTWIQQTKLTASDRAAGDRFGWSITVSADGNTIIAGATWDTVIFTKQGSAYVYKWNGTTWIQQTKLTASNPLQYFGISVSVSADVKTIIVGAYGSDGEKGAAYIFKWNGSGWTEQKQIAFDGAASDRFGISVAVSADGTTFTSGAYYDTIGANSQQGSAYIFRLE